MQKYVFWLYVSMDNIIIMHKLDGMTNLPGHCSYCFFAKASFLFQRGIEVSSTARLQNQVKKLFVRKKAIKLNNVWMVKKALNFDLSNQLVNKPCFTFENLLWNLLQGKDKFAFIMSL